MATSSATISNDKSAHLASKEIKKEIEIPVEYVESEPSECVLCVSKGFESFDIFTHATDSGTPLHAFIGTFTNTELPFCEELPKYICKTCLNLVNDLEQAKVQYFKLKDSFELIIRKNPLYCLSPPTTEDASQGMNKWVFNGVRVKPEPMVVEEEITRSNAGLDIKPGSVSGPQVRDDTSAQKNEKQTQTEDNSTIWPQESRIETATQTGGLRQYECTVCHRWFNTKGHLKTHSVTHTGDRPFECIICHRRFSLKGNLRSHMRTHTGEKPYNCDICQRQFSELTNFRYHVRTHTGERPFECDICHNRFNVKTHLKAHLRTHTGEKPYQCPICKRGYVEKRTLERHLKTHADEKS